MSPTDTKFSTANCMHTLPPHAPITELPIILMPSTHSAPGIEINPLFVTSPTGTSPTSATSISVGLPVIATEELWHSMKDRKAGNDIIISSWPSITPYDQNIISHFEIVQALITEVRNYRKQKNISPKESLDLKIVSNNGTSSLLEDFETIILKLANLSSLLYISGNKPSNSSAFMVGTMECFIPFSESIDRDAERNRLEKELEYTRGFLQSVMIKMGNKKFIENAKPEIIANETKKKQDAELKITLIEAALAAL